MPRPSSQEQSLLYYGRAQVLLQQGRPEEAIAALEASVEIERERGDAAGEGRAELLLSAAYHSIGALGDEHARLERLHAERAEAAYRRADDRAGLIDSLSWLIVLFNEAGDDVNRNYNLAKLKNLDRKVARWWRRYTNGISLVADHPKRAARLLRAAVNTAHVLPQHSDHWQEEAARKLLFASGGVDPGEKHAAPIYDETPDALASASWTVLFAEAVRVSTLTADEHDIEQAFDEAIAAAEAMRRLIRSEVKQRELYETMSVMYTKKAVLADRAGRYGEALDTIELNTSRSLLSIAALRELWSESTVSSWDRLAGANERIVSSLARYEQSPGKGEWDQVQLALKRRREASHWVQEQLVARVPLPHQLYLPSDTSSLQETLGGDDVVILFSERGPVYAVRDSGVLKLATVETASLSEACGRYRALASSYGRPYPDTELEEVAATIASAWVDPLAEVLGETTRLFIVPSKSLWGVPLASLGPAPLAASHQVGIVPSLSAVHRLVKNTRRGRRVQRFVGLGNPDESLPGATVEVENAAQHFDDRAVVTGSQIGMSDLVLFHEADVIHMACHAVAFADYPELSYLHIAGPKAEPSLLYAEDIIRVSMYPRLVVLSACHAGTSTALPGNEYVGFPGLFLTVGAQSVVAPLWAIPDDSTARLMDAFYQQLENASPAQALYEAQKEMQADPATAHPFHWAAFQVFGLP